MLVHSYTFVQVDDGFRCWRLVTQWWMRAFCIIVNAQLFD